MATTLPTPPGMAELFARTLAELPGAARPHVRAWREAAFERFQTLGLPGPKTETWKYTSIAPLARKALPPASPARLSTEAIRPFLIEQAKARLVFVNGHFNPALSEVPTGTAKVKVCRLATALEDGVDGALADAVLEQSPGGDGDGFALLNAAFAADGAYVDLGDGAALDGPLQLLFVHDDDDPAMVTPRNVIHLGDGARLDLIESHVSLGFSEGLTNLVNAIVLGRGAELQHDRLQIGDLSGTLIGQTDYRISADARLTQTLATLGGRLVRNEIQAVLNGPAIELGLNGLYITRGRQHVDNTIRIDHAEPGSNSDQFYKGVLDDQSRAVFAGKIVVRRDAQKTNAYQSNNNLVLSAEAEIDTKPELEIFADDVKCSHGATAGELDEHALFYLRSRGLDVASARSMLTFAFADEVIERFANPTVATRARLELLRWLPGGEALGELL